MLHLAVQHERPAERVDTGIVVDEVEPRGQREPAEGEPWSARRRLHDGRVDRPEREQLPDEQRLTPFGCFLRSTSLDELPELLNVLRGEMSLVGPRALAVGERYRDAGGDDVAYQNIPGFAERLAVRPGLTGMATVFLPKDAHPRERFAMDLEYVRTPSFIRDARLVLMSLWISVRGKWETRGKKI